MTFLAAMIWFGAFGLVIVAGLAIDRWEETSERRVTFAKGMGGIELSKTCKCPKVE